MSSFGVEPFSYKYLRSEALVASQVGAIFLCAFMNLNAIKPVFGAQLQRLTRILYVVFFMQQEVINDYTVQRKNNQGTDQTVDVQAGLCLCCLHASNSGFPTMTSHSSL